MRFLFLMRGGEMGQVNVCGTRLRIVRVMGKVIARSHGRCVVRDHPTPVPRECSGNSTEIKFPVVGLTGLRGWSWLLIPDPGVPDRFQSRGNKRGFLLEGFSSFLFMPRAGDAALLLSPLQFTNTLFNNYNMTCS